MDDILGWDIGGANLKAARINTAGAVSAVIQIPCPLWRGLSELAQAMQTAIELSNPWQRPTWRKTINCLGQNARELLGQVIIRQTEFCG